MTVTQTAILCTLIHFGDFTSQTQEIVVYINVSEQNSQPVTQVYVFARRRQNEGLKFP